MEKIWKTLSSKKVYQNRYFTIEEDDCLRPDGQPGKYFVMHRKHGVTVVPFDGKRLYLVNQYRYPCKERLWEFPAGSAETEDYLAEAKKELLEETGITAGRWTALGEFYCGPGFSDHKGKMFLAEDLTLGDPKRESGESDIIVKKFTPEEVEKMILTGEILDSWTITPFHFFKSRMSEGK
ncbi:MAG: NUDIX hydrolase [Patescibacteria group bacterium]|nr:NUDIX hydrolase [Patescibacteria group bacterium]